MIKTIKIKISQIFYNLPLGQKLFAFYLLFIIVPILIIGTISYSITRVHLLDKANQYVVSKIDSTNAYIENFTSVPVRMLQRMALDSQLGEFFTNKDYYDSLSQAERIVKLANIRNYLMEYINVDIYNYYIYLYTDNDSLYDLNFGDNVIVKPLKNVEERISQKQVQGLKNMKFGYDVKCEELYNGETAKYFGLFIQSSYSRKDVFILNISIPLNEIENILNMSDISRNGWVSLINIESLESDPNNSYVIQWNTENEVDPYIIEQIKQNKYNKGIIRFDNSIIIYQETFPAKFYVIASIPFSDIYGDTNRILLITVTLMIIFTAVLLPISYLASNYLTGRLRRFASNLEKSIKDIYEVKAEKGNDEISHIIRRYNQIIISYKTLLEVEHMREMQVKEYEGQLLKSDLERKAIELKLLQAQIDPHFLYNIFSSINISMQSGMMSGNLSIILNSVVKFYRLGLNKGRTVIKVSQEIDIIREYITIINFIYNNKIDVIYEIDEEAEYYWCIKFLLQPVVENAVIHGLLPLDNRGTLFISCEIDDKYIYLTVSDNGVGFDQELADNARSKSESGYGLKNVKERIFLFYKDEGQFRVSSTEGRGTDVTIIIPVKTYNELEAFDEKTTV